MIVVDTNILVYAYSPESPHHRACRKWIEDAFTKPEPVRLPWSVIHAFLRLLTLPHVVTTPPPIETLIDRVNEWMTIPSVAPIAPGSRYWRIFRQLLIAKEISGNLVNDAHIAALALENGASVCTADRDFRRFDGLTIINPLA